MKPGRRCGKTSNRSRWCMNPNAQPTRVESFDRSALAFFSNRRIRTRTYGGVGGAEPRGSPLSRSLALLRHADGFWGCLLFGAKPTSRLSIQTSQFDPERTCGESILDVVCRRVETKVVRLSWPRRL